MSTGRWVLSLELADAAALAPLRLERGVEACARAGTLWIRGPVRERLGDDLPEALGGLPATGRYRGDAAGTLRPFGATLGVAQAPDGPWVPLQQVLPVNAPEPGGPGDPGPPLPLRLVTAETLRPAALLLTEATTFNAWALTAPQVRLQRLSVAYDSSQRVLVRGTPLPPLRGTRLWEEGGIAVPCGQRWDPGVSAAVLGELFDLLPGDLIVLGDGAHDRLAASAFVPASRSVARSSP